MKKILFLTVLQICICGLASAQNKVTLTTYYPAPSGSYDRLRLVPRATIAGTNCNIGTIYYDTTTKTIKSCVDDGVDGEWSQMEGVWKQISNNLVVSDASNPGLKKVGVGTQTPELMLTLDVDGGIIAKGSFGSGNALTTSGAGTRLIWTPLKGALRAGTVSGSQWDTANIGDYSVAFGQNNKAMGANSGVLSGGDNLIDKSWMFPNNVSMQYTTIAGGENNKAYSHHSFIGGGYGHQIIPAGIFAGGNAGTYSTITGGLNHYVAGSLSFIGGGEANIMSGGWGVIAGGYDNQLCPAANCVNGYVTMGGGYQNRANGFVTVVAGGRANQANGVGSDTISGGSNNTITSATIINGGASTISGGYLNTIDEGGAGGQTVIGGGQSNTANGKGTTIAGGIGNTASGSGATVSGGGGLYGAGNIASGYNSAIGGGSYNTASGGYATIAGGSRYDTTPLVAGGPYVNPQATGNYATVGGGAGNQANNHYATVAGGAQSVASGQYATVSGGFTNQATADYATVGGGNGHQATGTYATVSGGNSNQATGSYATVGGGDFSYATALYATIGGGNNSTASANYATVAGGQENMATGLASSVGGGTVNASTGIYSTIPGGEQNVAGGDYSLAAGRYMQLTANADRTFVFGYDTSTQQIDTADAFLIYNANLSGSGYAKVGIGTRTPTHPLELAGGAYSDGVSWQPASSRELKENILPLSSQEAITTLKGLEPVSFRYKNISDDHVRQGFIAEDVPETVASAGRKSVDPMNFIAVLTKVVQEQQKQIEEQQREIEALKAKLGGL